MGWWERPDRLEHTVCYDERSAPPDRLVNKYSTFSPVFRWPIGLFFCFFSFSFLSLLVTTALACAGPAPYDNRALERTGETRRRRRRCTLFILFLFRCFIFFSLHSSRRAHYRRSVVAILCVPLVCLRHSARKNVQISWPFFSRSDDVRVVCWWSGRRATRYGTRAADWTVVLFAATAAPACDAAAAAASAYVRVAARGVRVRHRSTAA